MKHTIIAITGRALSGKTIAAQRFSAEFHATHMSISDVLHRMFSVLNQGTADRETLSSLAEWVFSLNPEGRRDALVRSLFPAIKSRFVSAAKANQDALIVIEAFRNLDDIEALQSEFSNVHVLALEASFSTMTDRHNRRVIEEGRGWQMSRSELVASLLLPSEQLIPECMERADTMIRNDHRAFGPFFADLDAIALGLGFPSLTEHERYFAM